MKKSPSCMSLISRKNLEEEVAWILKPSSKESLVNVAKAPLDDVETFSESHEMVTIQESLGDEVTVAPEFPDDAVEEDLEEKDAKSARAKL